MSDGKHTAMTRERAWRQGDPIPEPAAWLRDIAVTIYAQTGAWASWVLPWTNYAWFRESWQPMGTRQRADFLATLDPPGTPAPGNGVAHLQSENIQRAKHCALQEQLTCDRAMDAYEKVSAGKKARAEPKPEPVLAKKKQAKPETRNMWGGK